MRVTESDKVSRLAGQGKIARILDAFYAAEVRPESSLQGPQSISPCIMGGWLGLPRVGGIEAVGRGVTLSSCAVSLTA